MDNVSSELITVAVASYLLSALFLLAYKAGLNDFNAKSITSIWWEIRAVHPVALLAAFISVIPWSLVSLNLSLTYRLTVIGVVSVYFVSTLLYRITKGLKLIDFSIDTGSSFNDEISADPTIAQKIWLYWVSWAGAFTLGMILGSITSYNSWKDQSEWLSVKPGDTESSIYLYIFIGIILLSFILFAIFKSKKMRRLPTSRRITAAVNRSLLLPAMFGLFVAFLQVFTRNLLFTNRYYSIFTFVWLSVVSLWSGIFVLPTARKFLSDDRQFFNSQRKKLRKQRNKKRHHKRK